MVNRSRGEYAYTMIDIDNQVSSEIVPELEEKIGQIEDACKSYYLIWFHHI